MILNLVSQILRWQHWTVRLQIYICFLLSVRRDPEQLGEVDQASAADHVGHVPAAEHGRDVATEQGNGRIPDDAAHISAVARREDVPVTLFRI